MNKFFSFTIKTFFVFFLITFNSHVSFSEEEESLLRQLQEDIKTLEKAVYSQGVKTTSSNIESLSSESGDVLTPEPDNPEGLEPCKLLEATIGDAIFIGGSGAYCAGMAAKNYNSFPEAPEVIVDKNGSFHLARRRQNLEQIIDNEKIPEYII